MIRFDKYELFADTHVDLIDGTRMRASDVPIGAEAFEISDRGSIGLSVGRRMAPRIYVASSWRNERQPEVVQALRGQGGEVYDFRAPDPEIKGGGGFRWSAIDPAWKSWTSADYLVAMKHRIAQRGFNLDMYALHNADATILVMPCGRSAHLELGYAVGRQQRTVVLLSEGCEPELMWKMADLITASLEEAIRFLLGRPIEVTLGTAHFADAP